MEWTCQVSDSTQAFANKSLHLLVPAVGVKSPARTNHRDPPPQRPKSATLSIVETAALLGVDHKTVRKMITDGVIYAIRAGRKLLVPRSWLEWWLSGVDWQAAKAQADESIAAGRPRIRGTR